MKSVLEMTADEIRDFRTNPESTLWCASMWKRDASGHVMDADIEETTKEHLQRRVDEARRAGWKSFRSFTRRFVPNRPPAAERGAD